MTAWICTFPIGILKERRKPFAGSLGRQESIVTDGMSLNCALSILCWLTA